MRKIKFTTISALFTILLTSILASAGPSGSGGGKGVVCRGSNGVVTSVELLDLWEARVLYGRAVITSNESVETQINNGYLKLQNIFPTFDYDLGHGWDPFEDIKDTALRFLNTEDDQITRLHNVRLALTADSFEEATPEGCAVEQLIVYDDNPFGGVVHILVNQDLVDKLDSTNLAALFLHEGLYAELRNDPPYSQLRNLNHEKTSIRTRRAIGFIMAGGEFKALDTFLKGPHIFCESENGETVIVFVSSDHKAITIPVRINGVPFIGFEYNQGNVIDQIYSHLDFFLKTPREDWSFGFGMLDSPVDFDMSGTLNIKVVGSKGAVVTATLNSDASGNANLTSDNLTCDVFDK